jgi:hypothetical protein
MWQAASRNSVIAASYKPSDHLLQPLANSQKLGKSQKPSKVQYYIVSGKIDLGSPSQLVLVAVFTHHAHMRRMVRPLLGEGLK